MSKIFVSIASYRDPELIPTIKDCLEKADYPENLVFSIAWQHSKDDAWDTLDEFKDDSRFHIIDIDYKDTKGACWARHTIQQKYDKEKYYLQLDSHHRFVEGWDTMCIDMVKTLQDKGHKKPLLTAYIPSYNPDKDPEERAMEPWWMTFDRFIPEGAVFFIPATIPNWQEKTEAVPARFLSAHFIFTLGKWCKEVPYDPDYYFHGEEISLAARSYTWGYDLFHPHKIIAWHEYTRRGRTKQWDDDPDWGNKNNSCHKKNRQLFGMDGEVKGKGFGKYDFGKVRKLEDYERYAGISFKKRGVQQYTLNNQFPPNPVISDPVEYENSFSTIFKHCIDVAFHQAPEVDYDFWCVAFENEEGETIHRKDADRNEILMMRKDPDYFKIWRSFSYVGKPKKWVVWPHSESKGWCQKLEGIIP